MSSIVPFYERYPTKDCFLYNGIPLSGFLSSKERLDKVPEFEIRQDDICLASYPRTGTRWTAEILSWINHDGDEEKIKALSNIERCPYLEMCPPGSPSIVDNPDIFPPGQCRLFATHLQYEMAPQQLATRGKVVCVLRNPKDCAVSYYNFYRMNKFLGPYEGTWSGFYEGFSRGEIEYGSYFDFVKSWWEHRHQRNIIFIRYEEMKRDPTSHVKKLAEFLGKTLTKENIDHIVEGTSFQTMKNDPNTNFSRNEKFKEGLTSKECKDSDNEFIRKGQVGDWKNYFTVAQNEEFDKLIEEKFNGADLIFEY